VYADFIEDRLAQNSEYIALLKKGIQNFTPDWIESNFRQKIKYEELKPVDDFFQNLFQEYDDNERLFIYKSLYSQAGFENAIKNLEFFVNGLKIEIKAETYNYGAYMLLNKVNETEYTYWTSVFDYGSDNWNLKLAGIGEDSYNHLLYNPHISPYSTPYTWYISPWIDFADISLADLIGDLPNKYVKFGESPYIDSVIQNNDQFEFIYIDEYNTQRQITHVFNASASSPVQLDSLTQYWQLRQDSSGHWILQTNMDHSPAFTLVSFKYHDTSQSMTFSRYRNSDLGKNFFKITGDATALKSQIAFISNTLYAFKCNPCLQLLNAYSGGTYYVPPRSGDSGAASATPYYKISVSTTGEIFKDNELFQTRFKYLVQELLFYYGTPEINFYITYEVNAVNDEIHQVNVNSRNYNWFDIVE